MRRLAWLYLLVASCVDLSRPSVLLSGRDAPTFPTRDGPGGGGGGGGRTDGDPGDVPVVIVDAGTDQELPDQGEPIDTVGLDLLVIDPPPIWRPRTCLWW